MFVFTELFSFGCLNLDLFHMESVRSNEKTLTTWKVQSNCSFAQKVDFITVNYKMVLALATFPFLLKSGCVYGEEAAQAEH